MVIWQRNAEHLLLALSILSWVALGAGCASIPFKDPATLPHYHSSVPTEDGWTLSLFRLPADPAASAQPHYKMPVVLVHGTAVNRETFLLPGQAMAPALAESGFDVWLFELRGDRSSSAPDPKTWRRGGWTVDDFAQRDVPALLAAVRQATGRDQVYWVGHSLGGVLGYIAAQGPQRDAIAGLVTLGSPGAFPHPNRLARRSSPLMGGGGPGGQLPLRALGKLAIPLVSLGPDSYYLHAVFNEEHVNTGSLVGQVGSAMENMGSAAASQYGTWHESGRLLSVDGTLDYSEALAQVRAPALVVAGRIDHLVPPWWVHAGYEALGSEDKQYVVLGEGWGTRADYGHADFVLSDWANDEVFPMLIDWLSSRAVGDSTKRSQLQVSGSRVLDPLLDASDLELPAAEGAVLGDPEASGD